MTKSRKKGFCGSFFSEMESAPLKTYKTTKIWKKKINSRVQEWPSKFQNMRILWNSWSLISNWYFQNSFCRWSRTSSGTARFNLGLLSHHSSDLWRNRYFFSFFSFDSFKSFLWTFEVAWSLEIKLRSIEVTWGHSRSKLKSPFSEKWDFKGKNVSILR